MYNIFSALGNNLRRECLINPSILGEQKGSSISRKSVLGISSGNHGGVGGKWIKLKHDEKQKGEKHHIRRRILKLPHAYSAYYTSHLIMF